jgi:hypothetical protein
MGSFIARKMATFPLCSMGLIAKIFLVVSHMAHSTYNRANADRASFVSLPFLSLISHIPSREMRLSFCRISLRKKTGVRMESK